MRRLLAAYDLNADRLYGHINRIEARFTALGNFVLDGTGNETQQVQGRMISRYIAWRNRKAKDEGLRELVERANVA